MSRPDPNITRESPGEPAGVPSEFLTTQWTVISEAGTPGPHRDRALGELVRRYRPALKNFLRARFHLDADTADDVLQGFLLDKVLSRNLIASADRHRGKFRTFLLTAINRYVIDYFRREGAAKRIPRDRLVAIQALEHWTEPSAPPGIEEFDKAFVRHVLAIAVKNLEQYCLERDHETVWKVFKARVLAPALGTAEPKPYAELATELGLSSEAEARNRLMSAKRMFRRQLQSIVVEYSANSLEAEEELEEIRALFK